MILYQKLSRLHAACPYVGGLLNYDSAVVPYLVSLWLHDYDPHGIARQIVETRQGNFSYLFDIGSERLIAAWGVSRGANSTPRPKTRMAGHPKDPSTRYHRGHAIAHSLGGGTDINLLPQLGHVNSGPFQRLERLAVQHTGALYFTYWRYGQFLSQRPLGVDQGLLIPGRLPMIEHFLN